jgi:vacuolar-type H+-ATPase subunit C/Vma6
MVAPLAPDTVFLAARLHARRSRMAEGERLDAMCRLKAAGELFRAGPADGPAQTVEAFQKRLVSDLARELAECACRLPPEGASLCEWLLTRFQVENIKVLLRGAMTAAPFETLEPRLVAVRLEPVLDTRALASSGSPAGFAARLPPGSLRASLAEAAAMYPAEPRPFLFEAALDKGYLSELLVRAARLRNADDRDAVLPLARHEADMFLLSLAARGRFVYDLPPAQLIPLYVPGANLPRRRFLAMLAAAGPAGTPGTGDASSAAAAIESAAWTRFADLANRAFRGNHMGIGAVAGYAALRRIEAANLITLSEGLRRNMDAAAIRRRLIPRRGPE